MTDSILRTLTVYDKKAEEYANLSMDEQDQDFEAFLGLLSTGGHILDLGCGPGFASARFAREGFTVTATDGSAEMVKRADKHPGVNAVQQNFDEIAGTAVYDGIWANFSLLHAPRAHFPTHLAALHQAAKPQAVLHLAMKTGTGEGPDSIGRFYTYYTAEDLVSALRDAGFAPMSQRTGSGVGLSGSNDPWIVILARRA